jgi:hypothetical protein
MRLFLPAQSLCTDAGPHPEWRIESTAYEGSITRSGFFNSENYLWTYQTKASALSGCKRNARGYSAAPGSNLSRRFYFYIDQGLKESKTIFAEKLIFPIFVHV